MYVEVRNWRTEDGACVEQVEGHRLVRKTAQYHTAQLLVVAEYALDCPNPPPSLDDDGSIDVDLEGL